MLPHHSSVHGGRKEGGEGKAKVRNTGAGASDLVGDQHVDTLVAFKSDPFRSQHLVLKGEVLRFHSSPVCLLEPNLKAQYEQHKHL